MPCLKSTHEYDSYKLRESLYKGQVITIVDLKIITTDDCDICMLIAHHNVKTFCLVYKRKERKKKDEQKEKYKK